MMAISQSGMLAQAAHRRAAVRRPDGNAIAIYLSKWRATSMRCTKINPIAVPWRRPVDARRRFAP